MKTQDEPDRMTLRLPKHLREALTTVAKTSSNRSLTAEILHRLEKSFELDPVPQKDAHAQIKKYASRIIELINKTELAPVNRNHALEALSPEERILLEAFASLPEKKKRNAVDSLLNIISMLKS